MTAVAISDGVGSDSASAPAQPLVCTTPAPLAELSQQARRVQDLLEKAQSLPDPAARAVVEDCLQSVLSFYGEGLERMLQIIEGTGVEGKALVLQLARDPAVSGLLLIQGLHPLPLETRLHEALETVRPYMQSHGGTVELLSLENGFAKLRLKGTCQSCPSSTVTLELSVRRALEEACPDLNGFEVEKAA